MRPPSACVRSVAAVLITGAGRNPKSVSAAAEALKARQALYAGASVQVGEAAGEGNREKYFVNHDKTVPAAARTRDR